ncbi:carboxylating nicotinate-nucleotide diphosphorylase [Natronosporangium hydrolyticum]|uniref:Nicotinate-nucleotide pyrophosphorylase [carboxylating] n=1 Tax=Natronosporangium hydrolyticum TaxID=2811111 RepID=A0A895YM51_9ACTN|nr:carboxylating nicotinate-nucleotide diphosphorylase [Natronosporangium hydrolyticum]QSB17045.1 carboxylating nicotinate-nucleotide diphosphorylase [Natronosporangium hydrolyticum]
MGITATTVDALVRGGLDPTVVSRVIETALAEDLGPDGVDVTSFATVPKEQVDTADLVARADGVVAGIAVAAAAFELVEAGARLSPQVVDGVRVGRGDRVAEVTGPTRGLLTAERTALNLLCRLSGVATHTRAWADAIAGSKAQVIDTRKTTPGLRALEKYAVRVGGGANKRMGLYDVALIKDNHILAAGGVAPAVGRVHATYPNVPLQVEVTTVAQAQEAVSAGARFLLCDNLTPEQLRELVAAVGDQAELEATGGLTLPQAREYADTGVDYLSVGALTHSSPVLDIAMDVRGQ